MARAAALLLALLAWAGGSAARAADPVIPAPTGYVNDRAGVMGGWAGKTEALCRDIERATGAQVAVLTVRTTEGIPPQQYAQLVFDRWRIGKKGKDDGVLVLVAVEDRKLWIATGYGVEAALPDGKVGEIRDRHMTPAFRQGRLGEGIHDGVSAIGAVLGGGNLPPAKRAAGRRGGQVPFWLVFLLAPIVVILLFRALAGGMAGPRRHGGHYYTGGFGGADSEVGGSEDSAAEVPAEEELGEAGDATRATKNPDGRWERMKKGLIVVAVLGVLALLVVMQGVIAYNSIVKRDVAVNEKWGQVQNVLQRRADLIPNLVQTVKGYAAHEKQIFENVAAARAKLGGARTPEEAMKANAEISSALSRLLVIVENYPQLKADQTFTRLMDELAGAENRITVERMRYNEAVRAYNTTIRVFPSNVVAGIGGFAAKPFFDAEERAKEVPKVDFGK